MVYGALMIKTAEELFTALGGTAAICALANVKPAAVTNAKRRGIPWRWRVALLREAERRKLRLDPRLLETEAA